MVEVGLKEILGNTYEIHADSYGRWYIVTPLAENAEEDERPRNRVIGQGETLDAAVTAARVELNKRKVKVEVPFLTRAGEKGVAIGFHARNKTVLIRLEPNQPGALDQSTARRCFPTDMPKAKLQRYITLTTQMREMRNETNAIEREFEFDLYRATQKAIDAAVEAKGKPLARKR